MGPKLEIVEFSDPMLSIVNFGVQGPIVLYGISCYTESYYKGFLLYFIFNFYHRRVLRHS